MAITYKCKDLTKKYNCRFKRKFKAIPQHCNFYKQFFGKELKFYGTIIDNHSGTILDKYPI